MKKFLKPMTLALLMVKMEAAEAVEVGTLFPSVEIKSAIGKDPLSQHHLRGKITVINFWATWCEACKVELKEMQTEFATLMKNQDFRFVMISLDKDPDKARAWIKTNLDEAWLDRLYLDQEFSSADKLGVDAFPMTFVLDREGKVQHIQRGFTEGTGSTKKIAILASDLLR